MSAAEDVAVRYAGIYRQEKLALDKMIAEAASTKTALPNNYWHGEYAAREKLRVAAVLAQELPDV